MSGICVFSFHFLYFLFEQQNWGLFAGKWLVIRNMAGVGVRAAEVGGGTTKKPPVAEAIIFE
jgi:hypothetical protein